MSTPVFPELEQLREGLAALLGEGRSIVASAEAWPGKFAAWTERAERAMREASAVVEHQAEEARVVTRDTASAVAKCRALEATAKETLGKQEAKLAAVSRQLDEATTALEAAQRDDAALREAAHRFAAR